MRKVFFCLIVSSIMFLSCGTMGINLAAIFPSSQSGTVLSSSNSSGSRGTSVNSSQPARNTNRRADPDAANWDIEKLDTAKDAEYLSPVEKDVILEMNKVRSDPKKYAELYIQPELRYYNGNLYQKPGQTTIQTQEGRKAVEGCIAALSKMRAVPPLIPESGLSLAAKDHVTDQSRTGQTGHNGSDKSTPDGRCARYGKGNYIGENIEYGSNTGRNIVKNLLVDDGVPSRGHRTNIMKSDYTQTGTSAGTHPQFRNMCVIVYAKGYVSN
jgi:uncharacterized protein YkwD